MPRIESVTAELLHDQPLVNVITRVRDSDGLEGVGEAWWGIHDRERPGRTASPILAVINDLLAPRLVGGDPDAIERLWFELWDWGSRYADQGIIPMGLSGVAAGENEYALPDFDRLLATGALAYLQPDVTKIGGLTAARRVSALAELYLRCERTIRRVSSSRGLEGSTCGTLPAPMLS